MSNNGQTMFLVVSDKAGRLELNHLSLPLLLSSQLKVFGSLDGMLKLNFISINNKIERRILQIKIFETVPR